jgi:hypothetical protein
VIELRQPRRLGLVVAPKPGESLASWIDRLGEDMRCPAGLVADNLGLRVVPGAVQRPLSLLFGITATDDQKAAVQAATGVGAEVFDGMHLSAYDGTVLDRSDLAEDKASVQRVWFREWAPFVPGRTGRRTRWPGNQGHVLTVASSHDLAVVRRASST